MNTRTHAIVAVAAALVFFTCGGDIRRGTGKVLRDAGTFLEGMDASAQDGSSPMPANAHVTTADRDLSRLESGIALLNTPGELVAGPIIVTDIVSSNGVEFWVAAAGTCSAQAISAGTGGDQGVSGGRIPVRSGQVLCAVSQTGVHWAGFRPYD